MFQNLKGKAISFEGGEGAGKSTVMKIPIGILEEINEKRDINYITRINPNDLFNELNVERETIVFIAWLDYNYWADDKEKEELYKTFLSNQYEYEEDLKRRFYSTNKPMFFEERVKIQEQLENFLSINNKLNKQEKEELTSKVDKTILFILNSHKYKNSNTSNSLSNASKEKRKHTFLKYGYNIYILKHKWFGPIKI